MAGQTNETDEFDDLFDGALGVSVGRKEVKQTTPAPAAEPATAPTIQAPAAEAVTTKPAEAAPAHSPQAEQKPPEQPAQDLASMEEIKTVHARYLALIQQAVNHGVRSWVGLNDTMRNEFFGGDVMASSHWEYVPITVDRLRVLENMLQPIANGIEAEIKKMKEPAAAVPETPAAVPEPQVTAQEAPVPAQQPQSSQEVLVQEVKAEEGKLGEPELKAAAALAAATEAAAKRAQEAKKAAEEAKAAAAQAEAQAAEKPQLGATDKQWPPGAGLALGSPDQQAAANQDRVTLLREHIARRITALNSSYSKDPSMAEELGRQGFEDQLAFVDSMISHRNRNGWSETEVQRVVAALNDVGGLIDSFVGSHTLDGDKDELSTHDLEGPGKTGELETVNVSPDIADAVVHEPTREGTTEEFGSPPDVPEQTGDLDEEFFIKDLRPEEYIASKFWGQQTIHNYRAMQYQALLEKQGVTLEELETTAANYLKVYNRTDTENLMNAYVHFRITGMSAAQVLLEIEKVQSFRPLFKDTNSVSHYASAYDALTYPPRSEFYFQSEDARHEHLLRLLDGCNEDARRLKLEIWAAAHLERAGFSGDIVFWALKFYREHESSDSFGLGVLIQQAKLMGLAREAGKPMQDMEDQLRMQHEFYANKGQTVDIGMDFANPDRTLGYQMSVRLSPDPFDAVVINLPKAMALEIVKEFESHEALSGEQIAKLRRNIVTRVLLNVEVPEKASRGEIALDILRFLDSKEGRDLVNKDEERRQQDESRRRSFRRFRIGALVAIPIMLATVLAAIAVRTYTEPSSSSMIKDETEAKQEQKQPKAQAVSSGADVFTTPDEEKVVGSAADAKSAVDVTATVDAKAKTADVKAADQKKEDAEPKTTHKWDPNSLSQTTVNLQLATDYIASNIELLAAMRSNSQYAGMGFDFDAALQRYGAFAKQKGEWEQLLKDGKTVELNGKLNVFYDYDAEVQKQLSDLRLKAAEKMATPEPKAQETQKTPQQPAQVQPVIQPDDTKQRTNDAIKSMEKKGTKKPKKVCAHNICL